MHFCKLRYICEKGKKVFVLLLLNDELRVTLRKHMTCTGSALM